MGEWLVFVLLMVPLTGPPSSCGCAFGLCHCLRSGQRWVNSRVGMEPLKGASPMRRTPLLEDHVTHRRRTGCTDKTGEL